MQPRRLAVGIAILVVTAAVVLVGRAALSGDGDQSGDRAGAQAPGFPAPKRDTNVRFSPNAATSSRLAKGESLVARARGAKVDVYEAPRADAGHRALQGLPVESHRAPLVFLVRRQRGDWVQVSLPVRPNHASGWVRARDVSLKVNAYRLRIELKAHKLTAWKGKQVIASTGIATGRSVTPTPHGKGQGRYFVADLIKPPDPNGFYGPYALGLSAYSPVLTSFAGGDGQIGIHGTNQPSLIGTDVSHGCIRLDNATITRLARTVPVGTPVEITG